MLLNLSRNASQNVLENTNYMTAITSNTTDESSVSRRLQIAVEAFRDVK